jgi:hypothetical protein
MIFSKKELKELCKLAKAFRCEAEAAAEKGYPHES